MADEITIVVKAEDAFSSVLGNFGNIMTGIKSTIDLVSGAFKGIADFTQQFVDSASESEVVVAKLDAVLRATGGAAGVSSEQLQEYANQLQQTTRYSDEQILTGTTLLLTFRNIGEEVLLRAIPAMLDLGEIFGSEESAAMQLGKALNDPINGLGALTRAGVTFSDAQKEQIKNFVETNQLAQAQALILAEVEKQVGGTAEALGNTFAGKVEIAKNALDNFKELIGGPIIYLLGELLDKVMEFSDTNPAIQSVLSFFTEFNDLLKNPDVPFLDALGVALMHLPGVGPLQDLGAVLIALQGNIALGMDPFTAIALGLETLADKWQGTPFGDIIVAIQDFIKTGQDEGWGAAIGDLFALGFSTIKEKVLPYLEGLVDDAIPIVNNAFADADWSLLSETIAGILSTAIEIMFTRMQIITKVATGIDWATIGKALFDALVNGFASAIDSGADSLIALLAKVFGDPDVATFQAGVQAGAQKLIDILIGAIFPIYLFETVREKLGQIGEAMWMGLAEGLTNLTGLDFTWWSTWVKEHITNPIKQLLGIFSPSTVFFEIGRNIIQGLWDGMANLWDSFTTWVSDKFTALLENLTLENILKVLTGEMSITDLFSTSSGSGTGYNPYGAPGAYYPPPEGGATGTTATGAGSVINNFYGPVYFQGLESIGYECPSPHPLVAATGNTLNTSGIG